MNTITVYKMHMSRAYEYLPEGGQYWWSIEDQSRCDDNYEASVMESRLVILPAGYFVGRTRDGESAIFSEADKLRVEIGGKDHPHIIGRNGEIGLREEGIMKNTAEQIIEAINAGFAAGGKDEWDAPEFQTARDLTEAAGCVWDFAGWRDAVAAIRNNGKLGGIVLYDHTNEFHGTNESTYYVDSKGKTWWIYGVDNYPDSVECELPSDAVELDGSTVDDALIEHALEIERKHLR